MGVREVIRLLKYGVLAISAVALSAHAAGVSDNVVRIGVLSDMSGIFSDLAGEGSVVAAKLAIEDFRKAENPEFEIELLTADHQNKTDIAANRAREWYDVQKVDMITDVINSAVALAVSRVATDKQRLLLITGSGANAINNEQCSPNAVLYAWDTYSLANGFVNAISDKGHKSWYFVSVDYALGKAAEGDATAAVNKKGGTVLGSVKHPLGAPDFSAFMLQAHNSGAEVIGLANAGGDLHNAIRSANEYGINERHVLVALAGNVADMHALGPQLTQGMYLMESFYWDQDEASRQWSQRFNDQLGKMPNPLNAGTYSAVLQYLNAVKRTGSDDWKVVLEDLKKQRFDDVFLQNGYIREDNTMVHDIRLRVVKSPKESKGPWDLYSDDTVVIAGDDAYQPLSESRCPMVKK